MKVILVRNHGGPEVLICEDIDCYHNGHDESVRCYL